MAGSGLMERAECDRHQHLRVFERGRGSSFITAEYHTGWHHWCSALSERVWGGVEQRSLSRYLIAIICVLVAGWRLTEMVCTSRCLPGENVVNYGEREGGAHIFQKILSVERGPRWRLWWPSFGFEAGASERRGHWRLARYFLIKFPSKAFTPSVKVKVFWPISSYFCLTCSVLDKDPLGLKVLERYVQYQIQK